MRLMDYDKFKKEYKTFSDYNLNQNLDKVTEIFDYRDNLSAAREDRVNHPSHYTQGSQEAIVTIEEAIEDAPSVKAGMLQAQVLKYLLRLWHKDNPVEDAKKAQWYLNRLIDSL